MSLVNFLIQTVVPIFIRPVRNIGGIYANCTVKEVLIDEIEITEHPVQSGATISDHAFKKPIKIELEALWSDNGGFDSLAEIYEQLVELQESLTPFTVVTGKRSVDNMMFLYLAETNDRETENILSIRAVFQEVIIVDVETATIAPAADQADPATTDSTANVGSKTAQPAANASAVNSLFFGQPGDGQIPPPAPPNPNGNGILWTGGATS